MTTPDYKYLHSEPDMHIKVVQFIKAGFRPQDLYNTSLRYLEVFGRDGLLKSDFNRLMNWSLHISQLKGSFESKDDQRMFEQLRKLCSAILAY